MENWNVIFSFNLSAIVDHMSEMTEGLNIRKNGNVPFQ